MFTSPLLQPNIIYKEQYVPKGKRVRQIKTNAQDMAKRVTAGENNTYKSSTGQTLHNDSAHVC